MAAVDTRERILDAAEQLFAERGIAGTSLRAVTRAAGANLAAIHYYFGSKENLCDAVLRRRVGPLNQERLRLLEQAERRARGEAAAVEDILHAFIDPVFRLKQGLGPRGELWSRLIGRFYCEPPELVENLIRQQFGDVGRRFVEALGRALPELPAAEVYERFQFVVAVLTHVVSGVRRINVLREYPPGGSDDERALGRMCAFLGAGLRCGDGGGVQELSGRSRRASKRGSDA